VRDTIDFGIDLGTTTSAIALAEGGVATVIKNNDGWDCTPSAVWIPKPGSVHVGRRARERTEADPDNAAAEFKQEMGVAGAGHAFARAGASLTPVELSAEVLRSLRDDAAAQCGEPPVAAVITVPAAFALNQNNATREAAALAGFGAACPLVQEPTAAAFAYGAADRSDRSYWLVFDLGGGTFDAAVVSRRDGELMVLNHAGDPYLGGKLIDRAVVDRLLVPAAARDLGLGLTRDDPYWRSHFAALKYAAEEAKVALSRRGSVDILVDLADRDGTPATLEYTLTRGELDRVAEPFYVRAVNRCRDALAEGNLEPDDVDRLLLVGAATLAPGLRERLADADEGLGIEVDHSQDPSTVVARGAALYAATVRLVVPPTTPRAGEFTVALAYEPTTTTRTPSVGGRLDAATPTDWTGYTVTVDDAGSQPPFRSGPVPVSATGTFLTEVAVVPGAVSRFTLTLTDPAGVGCTVTPDHLSITHGDDEFGGVVLTQSVGIRRADELYAPLLRKGTRLPARARETFRTTVALRPDEADSVIRIPVVEGERSRAERNREVAMLEIRPHDVRVDLPAGSDVEVTFEIDESRLVTVRADVPLVEARFEAVVDMSHQEPPGADELAGRLDAVEVRLARLRASAEAVGSGVAWARLDRLDEEALLDSARDDVRAAGSDAGAAASGDQRLRDVQAELDAVEDAVELPSLLADLRQEVDECADLVEQVGDAEDRPELADLRRRADAAIRDEDPAVARVQLDRARRLFVALLRRTQYWELSVFRFLCAHRDRFEPADRVAALIGEGERAVVAGDRAALDGVNERLRRLARPDERDLIGGVMPL
jgi:molecular chaperone DnaK